MFAELFCERDPACEYYSFVAGRFCLVFIAQMMEWLPLVGSLRLYVSFAKGPYK